MTLGKDFYRGLRLVDEAGRLLVERVIAEDRTPCLTLGLAWTVRKIPANPGEVVGLRLVDDEGRLLETHEEKTERLKQEAERAKDAESAARAAAERAKDAESAARAAAERAKDAESAAREAAEARVRELEEELRRAREGGVKDRA